MIVVMKSRRSPTSRSVITIVASALVLAFTLGAADCLANDPVDRLRDALNPGVTEPTPQQIALRNKSITQIITGLRYLGDLRRAYFLREWGNPADAGEKKSDLEAFKKLIGERIKSTIRAGADGGEPHQLAAAMHIAEVAESDIPSERKADGKFAAGFANVLLGDKGLLKNPSITIRQAAIHALGKITPLPDPALDALTSVIRNDQLGPRRLAAYALYDLVKNAHFLDRESELRTIERAIQVATAGLTDADDHVRGHCLEAIKLAAERNLDYPWLIDPMRLNAKDGKIAPEKEFVKVLEAYALATPKLLQALSDQNLNIKLTAMMALEKISVARARLIAKIDEKAAELNPDKFWPKYQLLKSNGIADPLGNMVERGWIAIAHLLQRGSEKESVDVRRSAAQLLEILAEDIDRTSAELHKNKPSERRRFVGAIMAGLIDTDRFVRLTSTRALRAIDSAQIDRETVLTIGYILIDNKQNDADLSEAAVKTVEAIAGNTNAKAAIPFLKAVLVDPLKDAETRVRAMQALIAIGGVEANDAFPQIIAALSDSDVRVRRTAAEALGRLARPTTREIAADALRALRAALRDDDPEVRLHATEAILSIIVPKAL